MNQNNGISMQNGYIVPFGYSNLPMVHLNQQIYPYHSPFYNIQFLPTFYSSVKSPCNQMELDKIQALQEIVPSLSMVDDVNEKKGRESLKAERKKKIQESVFCNCSKSGCLKQYCRCFRMGRVCGQDCNCLQCRNCNKQLFIGKKKGRSKKSKCNCKKTKCSSKYCDCLASGGKCGEDCSCVNCENQ